VSNWRKRAREVINKARAENPKARGDELRAILKPLYPFGPREMHPYKMWLKEVKLACGASRKKNLNSLKGKSWLDCRED